MCLVRETIGIQGQRPAKAVGAGGGDQISPSIELLWDLCIMCVHKDGWAKAMT